jgi:hypothetical protein
MSRLPSLLVLLLVPLLSQSAFSQAKPAPARPAPKTPALCAVVSASVRAEAFGYKHVVSLRNGCDRPVECQVWTDVDPEPRQTMRAAPGETSEVVTRIGSPASAVSASKECRFL